MFKELQSELLFAKCQSKLRTLEVWLRRLVHESLFETYGERYFDYEDDGKRIISLPEHALERIKKLNLNSDFDKLEQIDFSSFVDVVTSKKLYPLWKVAFQDAFPHGREEAMLFLKRLIQPRNDLAHSRIISYHDTERIHCYSDDVIKSLKEHYETMGKEREYNVPQFIRIFDNLRNVGDCHTMRYDRNWRYLFSNPEVTLFTGDTLRLEVEVDETFSPNDYVIRWDIGNDAPCMGNIVEFRVSEKHVNTCFSIQCMVISKKGWHKHGNYDDGISIFYKVLFKVPDTI